MEGVDLILSEKDSFLTVRLFGNLGRKSNGERIPEIRLSAPTKLGEALAQLRSTHGIILNREEILILVNGVEANALEDLETSILADDKVDLLPIYHGG